MSCSKQGFEWNIIGLPKHEKKGKASRCSKTVDMPYAQKEERNFFGSVGFLVNKNFKDSVVEFRGDSSRVASLTIKINAKY